MCVTGLAELLRCDTRGFAAGGAAMCVLSPLSFQPACSPYYMQTLIIAREPGDSPPYAHPQNTQPRKQA